MHYNNNNNNNSNNNSNSNNNNSNSNSNNNNNTTHNIRRSTHYDQLDTLHKFKHKSTLNHSLEGSNRSSYNSKSYTNSIFSCEICKEYQVEPRLLSCLHSFCKGCLPVCVHQDGKHLVCPVCQESTKINSTHGLDGIPRNVLIEEPLKYWLKQQELFKFI